MGREMDLYDSDTGETLIADVVQDIASLDKPIELWYCKAKRGPIVQIRYGCSRIHYFYDEPSGQNMIREDEVRNGGISLEMVVAHAPTASI